MAEIGKHKLTEAMPNPPRQSVDRGGKPVPPHDVAAEEVREAQESQQARDAEASIRERMVDIGRGNQQAGRQGS